MKTITYTLACLALTFIGLILGWGINNIVQSGREIRRRQHLEFRRREALRKRMAEIAKEAEGNDRRLK